MDDACPTDLLAGGRIPRHLGRMARAGCRFSRGRQATVCGGIG